MAYENCIIANDVPEHREVLGDSGWYYSKNDFLDLAEKLSVLISNQELVSKLGNLAGIRAKELYSWDKVTTSYEQLFCSLTHAELQLS